MKRREKATREGFTLVELSFAIAFISILLITITLITNEIVSIYRKGYSIKKVNQIGRDIIDDFQNSITQSPSTLISSFCSRVYGAGGDSNCESDGGFYSVYQQIYAKIQLDEDDEEGAQSHYLPTGGLFCTGKYTYIWNTGYLFNKDATKYKFEGTNTADDLRIKLEYTVDGLDPNKTPYKDGDFRLLKIEDAGRSICQETLKNGYPSPAQVLTSPGGSAVNRTINIPFTLPSVPEELLRGNDSSLTLYDLVIFEPARVPTSNRLLYSGSFILGSSIGSVDIMTSSNFCKTPSNFTADFSYCSINKFNFSIQASAK